MLESDTEATPLRDVLCSVTSASYGVHVHESSVGLSSSYTLSGLSSKQLCEVRIMVPYTQMRTVSTETSGDQQR